MALGRDRAGIAEDMNMSKRVELCELCDKANDRAEYWNCGTACAAAYENERKAREAARRAEFESTMNNRPA